MCAVSAIYDYGRNMDFNSWDYEALDEFKKLVKAAKEFDSKTNQPDCEDPEKAKWIEIVERKVQE